MPRGARPERQLGAAGSFLRRLGDSGVHLHAVTFLQTHAQQLLPDAVARARNQGLTWQEIGQLLAGALSMGAGAPVVTGRDGMQLGAALRDAGIDFA
jgi:hypothetical protein